MLRTEQICKWRGGHVANRMRLYTLCCLPIANVSALANCDASFFFFFFLSLRGRKQRQVAVLCSRKCSCLLTTEHVYLYIVQKTVLASVVLDDECCYATVYFCLCIFFTALYISASAVYTYFYIQKENTDERQDFYGMKIVNFFLQPQRSNNELGLYINMYIKAD